MDFRLGLPLCACAYFLFGFIVQLTILSFVRLIVHILISGANACSYINSVETQKSKERVVDHRCFEREINLEKTTDYTPTMVTISGKITHVYVFGYHTDTPGVGA